MLVPPSLRPLSRHRDWPNGAESDKRQTAFRFREFSWNSASRGLFCFVDLGVDFLYTFGDQNVLTSQSVSSTLFFIFNNCIVPFGFLPREIRVAFPTENQLRQSRATQTTEHAECFSVSIIHRTLTRTIGALTCAQMLMLAIAHGGLRAP